jgi:hypothetical protein
MCICMYIGSVKESHICTCDVICMYIGSVKKSPICTCDVYIACI